MIVTEGGRLAEDTGSTCSKAGRSSPTTCSQLLIARWASARCPLAAGKHTIVFDFAYDGPGIAKGGTGVLKVDGQTVAR